MHCYVLVASAGEYYIGVTQNLPRRMDQHGNREVKSTAEFENLRIYHVWDCYTPDNAFALELILHRKQRNRKVGEVFDIVHKHPKFDDYLTQLVCAVAKPNKQRGPSYVRVLQLPTRNTLCSEWKYEHRPT